MLANILRLAWPAPLLAASLCCQAATDAELSNTSKLALQRLELSFPPGSLRNCKTEDLHNGNESICDLAPTPDAQGKRSVQIKIHAKPGGGAVVLSATLEFDLPLSVRFSDPDHKAPFVQFSPNALSGARLRSASFQIPSDFGTKLLGENVNLTIQGNSLLRDADHGAGDLLLQGGGLQLAGVQLSLPATALSHPFSMVNASPGLFRLDFGSVTAKPKDISFQAQQLAFDGRQSVLAQGLGFDFEAQPHMSSVTLTFNEPQSPVATLAGLQVKPNHVSYEDSVLLSAAPVSMFSVDKMVSSVASANAAGRGLAMSAASATFSGLVCQGALSLGIKDAAAALVGTGQV